MGFFRQEYWNGLPFPFPGDLPDPGIEPGPPTMQADALPSEKPGTTGQKLDYSILIKLAIGEGNGNPLQYSCLENSMDGGAW